MTSPLAQCSRVLRVLFGFFRLILLGGACLLCCCEQKPAKLNFVDSEGLENASKEQEFSTLSTPTAADLSALDPTVSGVRGELAPSQTPRPVRFVVYNLWNYLNRAREGEEPRFKSTEQIEAVVEILNTLQPDILSVSEIGTLEDLLDLQQRLKNAGLNLPAYAWTRGEDGVRNLGLLSRYPISQASNPMRSYQLTHRDGNKVNTLMERGILDVSLQLSPDYELRTLGAHLKSKRPVDYADEELIRSNEAQLLREHAEAILGTEPETNLLLYGDFNDTSRSRSLEILRGSQAQGEPLRLQDLPLEDENGDRWTHYWQWQDVYSRFDYALVNTGLEAEILLEQSGILAGTGYRRASDHRPLYLVIDVEAEQD